jgi:hypothetical protein
MLALAFCVVLEDGTRHMHYHKHECTVHALEWVLNNKKGNCAEQSRVVVGLAKAMGLEAEIIHVKGHFFTKIKVNRTWKGMDTCYSDGLTEFKNGKYKTLAAAEKAKISPYIC